MKRIKVLIWEGLHAPTNNHNVDLILHNDPSDESSTITVVVKNLLLLPELETIFGDELLYAVSEKEFDTKQDIQKIKTHLQNIFTVSLVESEMTPLFIDGGRATREDNRQLN